MDIFFDITKWWLTFFLIGLIFFPLTSTIFSSFVDRGYIFSKVIGLGLLSYSVLLIGIMKLIPFNVFLIFLVLGIFATINILIVRANKKLISETFSNWKLFLFEEVLFLLCIIFWSYIRSHDPTINGLEKFMDYGFINSILRSEYFPPTDMWFTPFSINYYYFGHLSTAVLTKISFIPSFITYNLMIATLFAFCFTLAFSLIINFLSRTKTTIKTILGGLLGGIFISLGGNLHSIYMLFSNYNVDSPIPFWQQPLALASIPNGYWYPNATRFIPFTIHEFPIYSFVVSDLHGHVLDIMYVLLIIGLIFNLFLASKITKINLALISFFLAILYMTNAWDGAIYFILFSVVILIKNFDLLKFAKTKKKSLLSRLDLEISSIKIFLIESAKPIIITFVLFALFTLPFNLYFKPFASGIGVLCAPEFLIKIGNLGPLLFEENHCQATPIWQIVILYGSFYFFVLSFIVFLIKATGKVKISKSDLFIIALILVSTILIIVPEFIYLKDIYPAHFRANTMFKLVYQSFMMLSLVSAYVIVRITTKTKNIIFYIGSVIILTPVLIYPYFAIKSYYGELKNYSGLDGIKYMQARLSDDYIAINWINQNIKGQPVIVEAQGDSYTDYGRVSSNTGLPTILGWTVHEWLWRGTYDIPAPRIEDIRLIYELGSIEETKNILKKYDAEYVYVGNLEKEKYINLDESKFETLGDVVFSTGNTKIYKLSI